MVKTEETKLMEKPQIVIHSQQPTDFTVFSMKWVPGFPKYVTLGQLPNGTGVLQLSSLQGSIEKVSNILHIY